jgi:general stress protein 26
MKEDTSLSHSRKELWEKIKDVRPGMLTTTERDGSLRSRPMWTLSDEFDGYLWFFTAEDSPKAKELESNNQVCISYSAPDKDLFISVSGRAELIHDKAKAKEFWNPYAEAWFPEGLDDPSLALLRVEVEQAEYWEDNKPKVIQFAQALITAATGKQPDWGENKKLDLNGK